jgi:hypothetical protein
MRRRYIPEVCKTFLGIPTILIRREGVWARGQRAHFLLSVVWTYTGAPFYRTPEGY